MYKIKYRKAEEMKDSCFEWLGLIPREWEVIRLKYLSTYFASSVDKLNKETEYPVFLCNYKDVYDNDLITDEIEFMEATATKQEIKKFFLKEGYILVTKNSEFPDDIAVPAYVTKTMEKVLCGYHLGIIDSFKKVLSSEFLYWFLSSPGIRDYFETQARGITTYSLETDAFENVVIPKISLTEQQKIADFLHMETARFDSIIKKKELLIEKLEEAKNSLVSQVITGKVKIVDGQMVERPPEEMKESHIGWLGRIPKNWTVGKVKYYYAVQLGKMLQPNKKRRNDTFEKYLCTINVDWEGIKLDTTKEMWFSQSEKKNIL